MTITFLVNVLVGIHFQMTSLTYQTSATSYDTLEVKKITNEFFEWYIYSTKNSIKGFQPEYARGKNGMTTLDFSKYVMNLEKYSFDDLLIEKELLTYKPCLENLEKIEYEVFEREYIDLDQFEEIDCVFTNTKRWTGGMDQVEFFKIKSVEFCNKDEAIIELQYSFSPSGKHYENGYKTILKRKKNTWKIVSIE